MAVSGQPCRLSARSAAAGLSEDQLRRVLVGSGTSLLGLVQHLAEAERYWFGHHLVGSAWDPEQEQGMAVPASRDATEVLRDYERPSKTATAPSAPRGTRTCAWSYRSMAPGTH